MAKADRSALQFWTGWQGLLLAFTVVSNAVAWWLIAWPVASLSNMPSHAGHFWVTFLHMIGGTGMLFLGAANLYLASRRIGYPLHRQIGKAYLIVGGVGASAALAVTTSMAHKQPGTTVWTNATMSLVTLALAWIAAALLGWRAARNRRFDCHRDWMIRSYILVWSFVFCRLVSRVPGFDDLGIDEGFIWLSWIGPLLLGEVALQWKHGSAKEARRMPVLPVTLAK